jgi:hypothetical protein
MNVVRWRRRRMFGVGWIDVVVVVVGVVRKKKLDRFSWVTVVRRYGDLLAHNTQQGRRCLRCSGLASGFALMLDLCS